MNTIVDGTSYGESCQYYEAKANKKLLNTDTIILAGYGACLKVEKGALVVKQGSTHDEQQEDNVTLYRGTHKIKQIIILADSGNISIDAFVSDNRKGAHPNVWGIVPA